MDGKSIGRGAMRRIRSLGLVVGVLCSGIAGAAPPARMLPCEQAPRLDTVVAFVPDWPLRQHGSMTLTFSVLTDGRVRQAVVVTSSSAELQRRFGDRVAAIVERWRFRPVRPACRAAVTVSFGREVRFDVPGSAASPPYVVSGLIHAR